MTAVKEELERCVMQAYEESNPAPKKQPRWLYFAVLGVVLALLVANLALIRYPAVEILRNGVVVFSCHFWVHIPIWIALIQLLALSNVLLRTVSMRTEKILLRQPPNSTASQNNARAASQPWPHIVILRHQSEEMLPQAVRAITSIANIALYAYATAVLGGMTMVPASDAVRLMVMFGANAGLGRIIGSYAILQDHDWKTTVVVDVAHWQIDELRDYVKAEIQIAMSGCRQ
ncbi:hypothetical protein J7T55_005234 [Diaporthe amygdali]|uniref:uncharacterized protein n=1 Tax=Phomopsis amygdali TaxID=1214568 RepID=UPI0022FF4531|nr:uncharacterized protein J7T55_005234 [Diaporthe amygdali]KAJ0116288.1 hypothetical protein J7T55_005234 [Diaporthe amygdali]